MMPKKRLSTAPVLDSGGIILYGGDMREVLPGLTAEEFDACVTDPPYELGFMGKSWDSTGVAYDVTAWAEVLRVLKPGAHLLAFGGTRTYHRMVCAIEDAGFEIRDTIQWLYGSGFPKSLDISKAIDKAAGAEREVQGKSRHSAKRSGASKTFGQIPPDEGERYVTAPSTDAAKEWAGWGTALKPANEPIVLARKPLSEKTVAANVLKWGTGALCIDGSRVPPTGQLGDYDHQRRPDNVKAHDGFEGKAFKRAATGMTEPQPGGRWPANVIHDGSEEVMAGFATAGERTVPGTYRSTTESAPGANGTMGQWKDDGWHDGYGDSGSAARFFYCAKASRAERNEGLDSGCDPAVDTDARPRDWEGADWELRNGNYHPTIKPIALMDYLVRLVTPPDGLVLDPFAGTGTTLLAARNRGGRAVGVELKEEYCKIAQGRLKPTPLGL